MAVQLDLFGPATITLPARAPRIRPMRKPQIPFVVESPDDEPETNHRNVIPAGASANLLPLERTIAAMIKEAYPRTARGETLRNLAQAIARHAQSDTHELNKLYWNPVQGNA